MCGRMLVGKRRGLLERVIPRAEDYLLVFAVLCILFSLLLAFLGGFFERTPGASLRQVAWPATTVEAVEPTMKPETTVVSMSSSTIVLTTLASSTVVSVSPEAFSGAPYECTSLDAALGVSYRVLLREGAARVEITSSAGNVTKVLRDGKSYTLSESGVWYAEELAGRVSEEVSRILASGGRSYSCNPKAFDDGVFSVPPEKVVKLSAGG